MKKLLSLFSVLLAGIHFSFAQTQLLWKEDFNDNNRKWTIADNETYKTEVQGGFYKINHKKNSGGHYFTRSSQVDPYMDFYIEIKLTQKEGVKNYGHGLLMKDERMSKEEKEYYFMISGDGSFKIFVYNSKVDSSMDIQKWKESNAIRTGYNQENILAVKQKGNTTYFYINGEEVYEEKKLSFWGSEVGFIVYRNQIIHVDHVLVKQDRGNVNLVNNYDQEIIKENMGPGINSQYSEIMPVISPDGHTLYLDVKEDPENIGSGEKEKDDVWFSTLNPDGTWSKRKNIGPPINNSTHNFVISVTPDNNSLILQGQYNSKGEWKHSGISISHRTSKGWSIPEDISIDDYYTNSSQVAFCISPDRNVLILAIERNDSYGDNDLYVSFRRKDDTWTAPKNMGKTLNTYGYEVAPFIAADGKTLYYSTNGKLGYGSNDIFMSKRLDESWTKWSEPQNLGPKINTASWDAYYTLPASGDYAYMVSSDQGLGDEDIFRVKVAHTAKPEPVVIIYGKVLNKITNEPLQANITYHDLNTDKDAGIARSNPMDGSYKIVLPYGIAYGFLAEKKDFLSESNNIDLTEVKEFIQIERNLYLSPIEIGKSITLNNVFFEQSKAVLLPGSRGELDRLVQILKDNPGISIELSGHTDNQGKPDLNVKLSENRVVAIKNYLVSKGISAKRITGKGYGGSKPVASNATEETRKLNRRVEFTIVSE